MRTSVRSEAPDRLLGASTACGFVLAVCGSNALTALLPRYQAVHGLGSLSSAVLFSMYFAALLSILLVSARGPLVRYARTVLPTALLIGVAADLLHVIGSAIPILLFPGRFLTGASVALSTGAAAAIMVAVRGEQGRSFIGTGSLLGAGAGLGASIALVVFLPGEFVMVFVVHGCLLMGCVVAVLFGLRAAPQVLAPAGVPHTSGLRYESKPDRRDRGAFGLGALAWAVGALAVGVLPAGLLARGMTESLLAAVCVGGACLWTSTVTGIAGAGLRVVRTPTAGVLLMSGGWALVMTGLFTRQLLVVVAGTVVSGLGQTVGYRVGLARLTRGLESVRQGQVASGYSASAYAGAGLFVILDGVATTWLGASVGAVVTGVMFLAGCLGAGWLCARRPNAEGLAETAMAVDKAAGQRPCGRVADLLN